MSIALGAVIVASIVANAAWNTWRARRISLHTAYPSLTETMGLAQIQDRIIVDTRILRYGGQVNGQEIEVEVGASSSYCYVRVDMPFERPIDLGLRVSSEREDGVLTRLWRLREIEIGNEEFDNRYILLARDEDRLHALLDASMQQRFLELADLAGHVQLNDDGLHLQMYANPAEEGVATAIRDGAALAQRVFARVEQWQSQVREERDADPMGSSMIAVVSAEQAR